MQLCSINDAHIHPSIMFLFLFLFLISIFIAEYWSRNTYRTGIDRPVGGSALSDNELACWHGGACIAGRCRQMER